MKKIIVLSIITLLIVGTAVFLNERYFNKAMASRTPKRQAVFMNNGQVYFGFISNPDRPTVKLSDVYYLKTDDLQSSDPNKKILLVKMGNELHGPEDMMFINRDQILFYQNLENSSKVNDAISRFSASQSAVSNPTVSPSAVSN